MDIWDDLRWFVVFNGIADATLWGFDADGWRLRHGDPANGMLGILPGEEGGPLACLADALWLADALAFDHDAPVGVSPAVQGLFPDIEPKDPAALPANHPVDPLNERLFLHYWESLNAAYGAAADLRFNATYAVRYNSDFPDPGTNFSERFKDRESLLALYAMATRQADLLAEYLCLYRVLEGADGANGKAFTVRELPHLLDRDFGLLRVGDLGVSRVWAWTDAFRLYKFRARIELDRLTAAGETDVCHSPLPDSQLASSRKEGSSHWSL
jgi:hypothetical protein